VRRTVIATGYRDRDSSSVLIIDCAMNNLRDLGEDKELNPKPCTSASIVRFRIHAEVFLPSVVRVEVNHSRQDANEADEAKDRETEIPDSKKRPSIPWRSCSKVRLAGNDEEAVEQACYNRHPR
jgi:hypothetical protein